MRTHDSPRPNGQPCWFDLMTSDLPAVTAFYAQLFGWQYQDSGPDFGNYHMAFSAAMPDRSSAGMGPIPPDNPYPSAWTVYYASDDVASLSEKAKELGGMIMSGPFEVTGQGHMAIIQDPTGAVFGLWQALGHKGAGISESHGAMTWCEVATPDAEAAKAFYTALFDAKAEAIEAPGTVYYVLKQGETSIGGIMQMNAQWQGIPPHWMPYFQVDDTDAAVAIAQEAGGKVMVPAFDTPFGRISVMTDPSGASFSVVKPV